MLGLDDQKSMRVSLMSIGCCTISFVFVLLARFDLSIVPRFFAAFSLLIQLPVSDLNWKAFAADKLCDLDPNADSNCDGVLGTIIDPPQSSEPDDLTEANFIIALLLLALLITRGCCGKLVGVSGSAPAFVIFTPLFIWGVYVVIL